MIKIRIAYNNKTEEVQCDLDDDDTYLLQTHKFNYNKKTGYVVSTKGLLLHRLIMQCEKYDGKVVDHIDGNKLNCQKQNLRLVTHAHNASNKIKKQNTSSKYQGVYKGSHNWIARISIDNKLVSLGSFKNEEDAAKAVNLKYKELYGGNSWKNDVDMSVPINIDNVNRTSKYSGISKIGEKFRFHFQNRKLKFESEALAVNIRNLLIIKFNPSQQNMKMNIIDEKDKLDIVLDDYVNVETFKIKEIYKPATNKIVHKENLILTLLTSDEKHKYKISEGDYDIIKDKHTYITVNDSYISLKDNNKRLCYLHHLILPSKKEYKVKHINGDGLDNTRENLKYELICKS